MCSRSCRSLLTNIVFLTRVDKGFLNASCKRIRDSVVTITAIQAYNTLYKCHASLGNGEKQAQQTAAGSFQQTPFTNEIAEENMKLVAELVEKRDGTANKDAPSITNSEKYTKESNYTLWDKMVLNHLASTIGTSRRCCCSLRGCSGSCRDSLWNRA